MARLEAPMDADWQDLQQFDAVVEAGSFSAAARALGTTQATISRRIKALEERLGKPLISHDNALYWRIFKTLGLSPTSQQGTLLSSLS